MLLVLPMSVSGAGVWHLYSKVLFVNVFAFKMHKILVVINRAKKYFKLLANNKFSLVALERRVGRSVEN